MVGIDKKTFHDPNGPIEHFEWGEYIILGKEHSGDRDRPVGASKDIRMIGTEVTQWVERKGHTLEPEMITGVYDRGIEVLILGVGVESRVNVPGRTGRAVQGHGIKQLVIEPTPAACRAYNKRFHRGERVALLAHGTC